MQISDGPCTMCWCRDDLLCCLELYQLVNPAINAERQCWPVWGWHFPLLCLCSFAKVRLHCHWCLCRSNIISQHVRGMPCIKTIICSDLVTDEVSSCIVQLFCTTGWDANASFYGKGKKSVYDQVMKTLCHNDNSHDAEIALTMTRRW